MNKRRTRAIRDAGRRAGHPLSGSQPARAARLAAPTGRLHVFAGCRGDAYSCWRSRRPRLVLVQFETFRSSAARVSVDRGGLELALAGGGAGGIEDLARIRARALACRRFGGDCHEMGVMLLVFTPCLYCNVSDSWMLPSKWQRIAIAAAGMYVELILAVGLHVSVVVQPAGIVQLAVLEHDARLLARHGVAQRQPAVALRRLFHSCPIWSRCRICGRNRAALERLVSRWCLGIEQAPAGPATANRQSYSLVTRSHRLYTVGSWWRPCSGPIVLARQYRLEVLVLPLAAMTLAGMPWPVGTAA